MNRTFFRAAAVAALFVATGCHSAFGPEPVLRMTTVQADAPAVAAREIVVRTGPSSIAPVIATLPVGTAVTSAQAVRGYHRVRTADGKSGYVQEGGLTFGQAAAPAAPAATPATDAAATPAPADAGAPAEKAAP